MSTPPEVENTRFHQLSLDTPQDKHRQLNQQNKSKHIWPRHTSHKSENNHQRSQAQLVIHNKKNMDNHSNSSQNRGRNQPTESHIYTRDEHHDGTNMGRNQSTVTQSGEQIKPHNKQV
jgi:hypothetical protein